MPGSIPGLPGFVAFAGLKFGGYVLAGLVLKKLQPGIVTSAIKIATFRTGLGIVLGPLFSLGFIWSWGLLDPNPPKESPNYLPYLYYLTLVAIRVCVWALVIYFATQEIALVSPEKALGRRRLWLYSVYGALWSCALDLPAFALAWVTPGQMPFC
jgi:hypothetical protein